MKIPCPFVYADGKPCDGHIVRVEAYKADPVWYLRKNGCWSIDVDRLRSHLHIFCSEKGDHSGPRRQTDPRMKYWPDQLPDELREILFGDLTTNN